MTILSESEPVSAAVQGRTNIHADPSPPPREVHLRTVVVVTVAAALALLIALLVFEGPVASVWYGNRQQHRAHMLTSGRPKTLVGQTLAVVQYPAAGLNVAVVEGDTTDLLRGGPGHVPGTPIPGDIGNSVVFGHATGWGGPFSPLAQIAPNDVIYVRVHGSRTALAFTVISAKKVNDDRSLLGPSNDRRLTLVTGSGGRLSSDYLVVTAVSGTVGAPAKGGKPAPNPPTETPIANRDFALFVVRALIVVAVIALLRRRYRPGVVAVLATPLVLAALLGLMLQVDGMLPPLG